MVICILRERKRGEMLKRDVCSAVNLFVIMLHSQLVSSQLPADQVSAMTSVYEIVQNNAGSYFVWSDVLKTSNPCSWMGVGCSPDNSSINTISFTSFSISTSEYLPFLCNISTLESLDVSYNLLSSIPDGFFTACGEISGLKLLNFAMNRLNGLLPTFNNGFRVLENLDFSRNSLSGEISLQLNELDSLKSVDLRWNRFGGKIPTNLGKKNLLEELFLSANNFTGEIPIEITKYKNLREIDLRRNQLSRSVPKEFGELTKLKTLDLSLNSLSGEIPTSISNITTLQRFAANHNNISGTIPLGITSFLSFLDLSYNSLAGIIPFYLLSRSNLQSLDLSFNNLEGPIPPITSRNLLFLNLRSNSLNGTIPSDSLWSNLVLTYLELDSNRLSGEIPPELGMCKNLSLLNLAKNRLRGTLPPSLGNLTNLQSLYLESNNLVGEIPPQISQLRRLETLNLSRNSLTGSIPMLISRMRYLFILDLQGNKLGGPIPDSFAGLSSLLELQLGSNQLNGRIPLMPESLTALNLSHNLFEGSIPSSLSTLWRRLQVLDLSNNSFSGEIPSFLAKFFVLTHLLLMNNDLSGVVPTFTDRVKVETRPGNDNLIYDGHRPAVVPHRNTTSMFNSETPIAVASGFPVGLVISIIAIFISRKYKRIHHHLLPPTSILRSAIDLKRGMEAVSDPSNITHKTRFSTFYKAVMPSGSTYIVKKINHSTSIFNFPRNREFQEELEVLGNLSHPNVMIPKAYVLTPRRTYLFYDFVRGTLHDILHRRMGNSTLDWASRYSIAVGVAKGLAYLHECSSGPVLLLDLSTKTILLKSLVEPRISDIELCKFFHPSNSISFFSDGYAPPEYGCRERVTAAGNVYSYGVLLLELLTGKAAVSDEGTELAKWALTISEHGSQREQILDSRVSETSLAGVRNQMLAVLEVALACISVSPEMRPNAVSVLQMLQSRRSSIINGSN